VDLHLVPGAEPTAAESAALDSVLGPSVDGWDGGERLDGLARQPEPSQVLEVRVAIPRG